MGQSEQGQTLVGQVVDDLNPVQFFADMQECFGTRRMVELVGYAVLWGVLGVEDVAAMRRRYEEAGLSRRGMYRAAADYKKFGSFLVKKHGERLGQMQMKELLDRMQNRVPNMARPVI